MAIQSSATLGSIRKFSSTQGVRFMPHFFGFLFFTSFIYTVPYMPEFNALVFLIKRVLYALLFLFMCSAINWKQVRLNMFFWCIAFWLVIHVVSFLIHQVNDNLYLSRLAQGSFVYVLVVFLCQFSSQLHFGPLTYRFIMLGPSLLALVGLFLAVFDSYWASLIQGGFNGYRVGFSIWLAQIVFLILFCSGTSTLQIQATSTPGVLSRSSLLKALVLIAPIIGLQVFASGRIGLLASAIICIYFCYRVFKSWLAVVLSISYLALTISLFSAVQPPTQLSSQTENYSTLRGLSQAQEIVSNFEIINIEEVAIGTYSILDIVSSYRLAIFIEGLRAITPNIFFSGKGVGEFVVYVYSGSYNVHNVFLNTLGELGIAGLLVVLCIIIISMKKKPGCVSDSHMRFFIILWVLIALLEPELLLTKIGLSLIFWVAFAKLLVEDNRPVIGRF